MLQFTTLLDAIDGLTNLLKKIEGSLPFKAYQSSKPSSLTEFTKLARVEPLTVLSKDLLTVEYMPEIMQTMLNIFVGYYLQAVAITSSIESVRIIKVLDRLNPDRDPNMLDLLNFSRDVATSGLGFESYDDTLYLSEENYKFRLPKAGMALEGKTWRKAKHSQDYEDDSGNSVKVDYRDPNSGAAYNSGKQKYNPVNDQRFDKKVADAVAKKIGKDNLDLDQKVASAVLKKLEEEGKTQKKEPELDTKFDRLPYSGKDGTNTIVNEVVNLAVGKYIDVTVTATPMLVSTDSDKSKVENVPITLKIPVNVRLAPVVVPDFTIDHILTIKKADNTFVERYHSWRSGRISFIKDLIFCQDMIDAHKKALMNDETGTYAEIMRRVSNSMKKGVLTQNPSLSSASNIFIISDDIARNIEVKLGGKLSNARIRQKAFENTYAMIIAVVDRRFERVIFYYRGIETATNVSLREIKASNKSKGPDILDVFKALNSGNAASF